MILFIRVKYINKVTWCMPAGSSDETAIITRSEKSNDDTIRKGNNPHNPISSQACGLAEHVDPHSSLAKTLGQPSAEFDVHFGEILHRPLGDERGRVAEVGYHVVHQSILRVRVQNFSPEGGHLAEIVLVLRLVAVHVAAHVERRRANCRTLFRSAEAVGVVIRCTTLVVQSHQPVALVVHRRDRLENVRVNQLSLSLEQG